MSARVESAPVGRFNVGAIAIAVVVALGIGALAGLLVTRASERPAAVTTPAGIPSWDAQKLEAMEGRQLAEQQFGIAGTQLWDAQKLEAMEGRRLAEQLRAEDPITKPHLPKRPPTG
jgi:hypothetical protein